MGREIKIEKRLSSAVFIDARQLAAINRFVVVAAAVLCPIKIGYCFMPFANIIFVISLIS